MSVESITHALALRRPVRETPARASLDHAPREQTVALAARISRQLSLALAPINLVCATLTYIFVAYVAPLPGGAPPSDARRTVLIVAIATTALCWGVCELWGRQSFRPVRTWLDRGGNPEEAQRTRTVRFALYVTGHTLAVWLVVALGFCVLDIGLGGSGWAGFLVAVMVALGGLSASALTYLAVERIMRPAIALALESDPPVRPLVPGIATRIYLAWEFGTAVAVAGAVVVAIAALAGAGISVSRLALTVIFLGGVALTVGLVTLLIAVHSVADPVRSLRGAMAAVERGDTQVAVPVDDGGEVGLLQAGFNRMVAGLRERDLVRDLFGRHVGEEVARSALAGGLELGGEVRDAAVLFIDLMGSTTFAASRDPSEVVQTLNRFFGIVVDVVTMHGGWVNKFEGDAALCAFGAPSEHPDAAGAALASARELSRRLHAELPGLDAAIGLSAGSVVAGNIGAADRYEYTVIGDPVNEAARLTELAKVWPERLLATEAIVRLAREAESARWQLSEQVTLRGRADPTLIAMPRR